MKLYLIIWIMQLTNYSINWSIERLWFGIFNLRVMKQLLWLSGRFCGYLVYD